ncbi:hypothetical protein MPTK2_8g02900 [Marchantia polymorpha subsp. ruderalis]
MNFNFEFVATMYTRMHYCSLIGDFMATRLDAYHWSPVNLSSFCSWTGVICSNSSRKLALVLPGTLKMALLLRVFSFGYNDLLGNVPEEPGKLANLEDLVSYRNDSSGVILNSLALFEARTLDADNNYFTGPSNNPSGIVSEKLGELANLTELHLYSDGLTGPIPVSIAYCSKLSGSSLVDCSELKGSLHRFLVNCTNMQALHVSTNPLSSIEPREIGRLNSLQRLYVHENLLQATIPPPLTNCSDFGGWSVDARYIFSNKLTGIIPVSVVNCSSLSAPALPDNSLTGSNALHRKIPPRIGNLRNSLLTLGHDRLGRAIPRSLEHCGLLRTLDVDSDEASGILEGFARRALPYLQVLDLSDNRFTGHLPVTIQCIDDFKRTSISTMVGTGDHLMAMFDSGTGKFWINAQFLTTVWDNGTLTSFT